MTKQELTAAIAEHKNITKNALQLVYDSLNNGQKKQLLKNAEVAELFARYEVET